MKRETESSPYRIYYNSPENFKLQFFSVKCFTYETENIDTQAIEILQGGYVRNCIAECTYDSQAKMYRGLKTPFLQRSSMIDTRG